MTLEQITNLYLVETAKAYGVTVGGLLTHSRRIEHQACVVPRYIVMHLLRRETDMTTTQVSHIFNRDRSSVSQATRKFIQLIKKPSHTHLVQTICNRVAAQLIPSTFSKTSVQPLVFTSEFLNSPNFKFSG